MGVISALQVRNESALLRIQFQVYVVIVESMRVSLQRTTRKSALAGKRARKIYLRTGNYDDKPHVLVVDDDRQAHPLASTGQMEL